MENIKLEPWDIDTTVPQFIEHRNSLQKCPAMMSCRALYQADPRTGHLDFSQQATSSDDEGTAHKPRNLAAAELLTAGMAQIA